MNNKKSEILLPTEENLKSVNLSHDMIRIDKLKSDINDLRVPMKIPNRGLVEQKFNTNFNYTVDTNDNTIMFTGGYLGNICTTLSQPDKAILGLAKRYLGTFTWDARQNPRVAGMGSTDNMTGLGGESY